MTVKGKGYLWPLIIALPLAAAVLGCLWGSTSLSPAELWQGLTLREGAESASLILYRLRLPRVAAAALAGVGLSLSGVLLQCVTGNPLAAPGIIGVNSGAGFACILTLALFPSLSRFVPLFAFGGALLTTLLILAIARCISATPTTVILSGVAVTALLNAGISLLGLFDTDVLVSYNAFSVGGVRGVQAQQLLLPTVIICAALALSLLLAGRIHLLCLGREMAAGLGVRVNLLTAVCLLCASAAAGAAVSFAGLLGFVGLVVPHMARRMVGEHPARLLPCSACLGAAIVTLADLLGRVLAAPTEIPVGILMAFVGAPFFFLLLWKRREHRA